MEYRIEYASSGPEIHHWLLFYFEKPVGYGFQRTHFRAKECAMIALRRARKYFKVTGKEPEQLLQYPDLHWKEAYKARKRKGLTRKYVRKQ